jgi:cytochrome c oxidase cbb3-type subunit 4
MSDSGLLRGLITLVTLLTFLGICWWAYRPSNRTRFDEDAWMVFDEDELDGSAGERTHVGTREGRQT